MSVRLEIHGAAAVLVVDRPATKNAIDPEVHAGLERAFGEAEARSEVRAVVLTGAGGSFVSGGDLKYIRDNPAQETLLLSRRTAALLDRFEASALPVIAAIDGPAYGGGCEIALACDYRIASATSQFSFRQAAMGLTTGWGASRRLARLVPRSTAFRLLAFAEVLGAEQARALHLVDETVDETAGAALARALERVRSIESVSKRAVAGLKRVLAGVYEGEAEREWEVFAALWGGEDHREALDACFARRAPRFGS